MLLQGGELSEESVVFVLEIVVFSLQLLQSGLLLGQGVVAVVAEPQQTEESEEDTERRSLRRLDEPFSC